MFQKTIQTLILSTLSLLLSALCSSANASDLAKEKRMKDQVIDYIMDGEAVLLKAGSHEFLSIYMEAETLPAKGAVIIIHGRGYHPNWPELVYPLRSGLPTYGWDTLSIQMPVLDNQSSFYDYLDILDEAHPRINAAVDFLKQKNIKNIILLAHSCGVHMAVDWLHKHDKAGITGFIGIGMGSTDYGQPMRAPYPLDKIKVPILDIRGEDDYPAVIRNAPRRLKNMKIAAQPQSQQRVVAKADHDFTGRVEVLLIEIADWLKDF